MQLLTCYSRANQNPRAILPQPLLSIFARLTSLTTVDFFVSKDDDLEPEKNKLPLPPATNPSTTLCVADYATGLLLSELVMEPFGRNCPDSYVGRK